MTLRLNRLRANSVNLRVLALALVLLSAFALRLYQLDSQSFWDDEAFSAIHARPDLLTLLRGVPSDHTPGYFVLLHFWMLLTGDVDFSIRFLSVFFGTLSVALIYILARRLSQGSHRVALAAAFIAALNPFAVYYSQEARMYSQLLAFATLTLFWFARAYARPDRRANWIAHTLALGAAIYTHYYAFALLLAEAGFLLLERRARARLILLRWFGSLVGVGLLFLPWTLPFLAFFVPRPYSTPVDLSTFPAQLWSFFLAGTTMPNENTPILFAIAALLLALGVYVARKMWRGRLLISTLLVPFLALLAVLTLRGQGVLPRYLIVLLPAFVVLVAMGVERLSRAFSPLAGLGLVLVGAVAFTSLQNYWFDEHYSRPGWRQTAQYLAAHARSDDVVLFDGFEPSVAFQRYYVSPSKIAELPAFKASAPASRVEEVMSRATADTGRVWLVLFWGQPGRADEWLNRSGFQGDYEEFAGVYLTPYLLSAQVSSPRPPAQVEKQVDVELANFRVGDARPGEMLPIALTWRQGAHTLDRDLQVSVRLIEPDGDVAVALDRAPRAGFRPTSGWQPGEMIEDRYALNLPAALEPGDYSLRVLLYDPADGAPRLEATLGTIHIGPAAAGN